MSSPLDPPYQPISPNPPTTLQSVLLDAEQVTHNRTQISTDEEAHRNTTHHPATHPCDLGTGLFDQARQGNSHQASSCDWQCQLGLRWTPAKSCQ